MARFFLELRRRPDRHRRLIPSYSHGREHAIARFRKFPPVRGSVDAPLARQGLRTRAAKADRHTMYASRRVDVRAFQHGYGEVVDTVALGALGAKLLAEARSLPSGRCSVTVHGGHVNSLRQTVIGVAAGHRLDEHENTGEITLQLLTGRARVLAASDEVVLVAGDYVVIPPKWESFEALEDSVVLLTAAVQSRKG